MRNCLSFIPDAFFCLFFSIWYTPGQCQQRLDNASFLHRSLKRVTDVIVYDVYSPPVASRIYAYTCIAGYEAARRGDTSYHSLAGQLKDLPAFASPEQGREYNFSLSAIQAMLQVARSMVISDDSIVFFQRRIQREFKASGMPADVFNRSIEYGSIIATQVQAWAAKDNYKQTRSFAKYSVSEDDGSWRPTPPAYMKAIEPHWNKLRPFLLDSASQFKPIAALEYSTDKNSSFYKEAERVYTTVKQLSSEQKEIANFWDCNPFKINVSGHVMFATKKISPGGHWVNIAAQACKQAKLDFMRSAEVYVCLSLVMADAFISCWDEKYRSRVIRPETYINQFIDPAWMPLLQTPPFPEYSSGHSVISAAAAAVLTKLFGEGFSYTDATEMEFGLPARKYTSFWQAAEEAGISRFYGGIHYMPAIENGMAGGRRVGEHGISRLKMH